jgi:polysaccharide export outer membrane protein
MLRGLDMKYNRIFGLIFYLGNRKREKSSCRCPRIFCLLTAIFLAACSASNPPREDSSYSQAPTIGTPPQPVQKTAEGGSASPSSAKVGESIAASSTRDYQIGSFDLLKIDVFQVPELSQEVRVNSEGFISLPLIGAVQVNGLTSQQMEELLAKILGEKYLQDPQVSVFIKEYISQRVTVEGAVTKPGIYPIQGRTTLLQAIASAQGVNDVANQAGIKLFRSTATGDNKKIFYYDIDAIRQGISPDPEIRADDIIVVEESGTKVFWREFANYFRLFLNPFVFF